MFNATNDPRVYASSLGIPRRVASAEYRANPPVFAPNAIIERLLPEEHKRTPARIAAPFPTLWRRAQ